MPRDLSATWWCRSRSTRRRPRPFGTALLINLGLLSLFAIQHSVMARPWFKRVWTRVVPQAAERSTYVLASSLALILLFWQWSPLGGVVWDVQNPTGRALLYAGFAFGWLLVLVTTFLINHFDLFGLRQVWLYLRGRAYRPLHFVTPGPYRLVRHPLYVGWLFAFWATPTMTVTHLLFAVMTTAYILVAIQLEERDLVDAHPEYAEYKRRVPMIVPDSDEARGECGRNRGCSQPDRHFSLSWSAGLRNALAQDSRTHTLISQHHESTPIPEGSGGRLRQTCPGIDRAIPGCVGGRGGGVRSAIRLRQRARRGGDGTPLCELPAGDGRRVGRHAS